MRDDTQLAVYTLIIAYMAIDTTPLLAKTFAVLSIVFALSVGHDILEGTVAWLLENLDDL